MSGVEAALDEAYYCLFDSRSDPPPETVDGRTALEGVRSSASALRGATCTARNRRILARGRDDVFVVYEKVIALGDKSAHAVVLEAWMRRGSGWRLVREVVEHL